MKKYNHYVITWWDNNKRHEKEFKLEKAAKKFASMLAEMTGISERNFYSYDSNWKEIESFSF